MTDEPNVMRQAFREIKWLANSLKGMLALADELEDVADIEKHAKEAEARAAAAETRETLALGRVAELEAREAELKPIVAAFEAAQERIRRL